MKCMWNIAPFLMTKDNMISTATLRMKHTTKRQKFHQKSFKSDRHKKAGGGTLKYDQRLLDFS